MQAQVMERTFLHWEVDYGILSWMSRFVIDDVGPDKAVWKDLKECA